MNNLENIIALVLLALCITGLIIVLIREAKENKEVLKKVSIENCKSLEYKYQIEKLIVNLSKIAEKINDDNLIK